MLTLKTAKYKKKDFLTMYNALTKALLSIKCNNNCETCESYNVCHDLMSLRGFVVVEYFKPEDKGNT